MPPPEWGARTEVWAGLCVACATEKHPSIHHPTIGNVDEVGQAGGKDHFGKTGYMYKLVRHCYGPIRRGETPPPALLLSATLSRLAEKAARPDFGKHHQATD